MRQDVSAPVATTPPARRLATSATGSRLGWRIAFAGVAPNTRCHQIAWAVVPAIRDPLPVLDRRYPHLHQFPVFKEPALPTVLGNKPISKPCYTNDPFAAVKTFAVLLLDHLLEAASRLAAQVATMTLLVVHAGGCLSLFRARSRSEYTSDVDTVTLDGVPSSMISSMLIRPHSFRFLCSATLTNKVASESITSCPGLVSAGILT